MSHRQKEIILSTTAASKENEDKIENTAIEAEKENDGNNEMIFINEIKLTEAYNREENGEDPDLDDKGGLIQKNREEDDEEGGNSN